MNVYAACQKKSIPFSSAVSTNLSFVFYMAMCWLWITSPYSVLLSPEKFAPPHLGLIEFTLLVVCTFGKMLPRVIIGYLTRSPFPTLLPTVMLPILGGTVLANLGRLGVNVPPGVEIWYTHLALLFSFVSWQLWAAVACQSFCRTLGIYCLTIKPKRK
ncbi:hypothetical protein FS749_001788 [Ceratobasidium sp. UAMH 11750]|nr:hypothetical protein FS749_001788 [Ceratobasidium sp. UAMH 11750]